MASKDHSVSVYLRVECKSLQARRITAGVTATLQSCNHLQLLGLRLGAWPAAVCISVTAARHVRARRIHSAAIVRSQPACRLHEQRRFRLASVAIAVETQLVKLCAAPPPLD